MKHRAVVWAAFLAVSLVVVEAFGSSVMTDEPPSLLKKNFSEAEINSCLDTICGGAEQNWPFLKSLLDRKTSAKDFEAMWAQKIAPKLNAAVTADAEAQSKIVDRLAKLIQAGKQPKLGHPMQVVAMQTVLANIYINPHLQDLLVANPISKIPELDAAALAQVLNQADTLSRRAAIEALIKSVYVPLLQNAFREALVGSGNDLQNRLAVKYPNTELAAALKADAQALLENYARIGVKFGHFTTERMVDDTAIVLVKKAATGADLASAESDAYLKVAQAIETSATLMEPALYKTLLSATVDPAKIMSGLKSQNAVAKKRADLAHFTAAKRTAAITSVCSARLNLALNSTASLEQVKTLEDLVPAVKAAAKSLLPRFADSSSLPQLDAAIDKAEFSFPASEDDSTARVNNAVGSFAAQAAETTSELTSPSEDLDQVLLWSAPELLASQDEVTEPLIDVCSLLPTDDITDHTLTAAGRITVSWFTAAYPDRGLPILAHELGHVVSAALRTAHAAGDKTSGFLSSLDCVANRNPFVLKPVHLKGESNTTWSEEDWADHFSSELMNALAEAGSPLAKKPQNLACAIALTDDLNSVPPTFAPADGDSHSSTLLRALSISIDRKIPLAPACRAFTAYAASQHRALTCQ